MGRLPAAPPETRFPLLLAPALLAILVFAGGCAPLRQPAAGPEEAYPAEGAPSPGGTEAGEDARDEAVLAARAHQAAGERASFDGDEALAREEFEAALAAIEGAGEDARLSDLAVEIRDQLALLDAEGAAGADSAETEPGEIEPSPLDDLDITSPEIGPAAIEEERNLVELATPSFDIPMVFNDRVLSWVDFYSNRHRAKFLPGLARSGRFLPMIQRIFAEEGLPRDLAYMAHVESAYKTNAYSRAKAKGIFQFIQGTGRRYGLRIDYWVDERSDPEKATRAAAAYLRDLYAMFDDWYLALAAYNTGEGKIQRLINRTGQKDFWHFAKKGMLHRETANYVPAILAATLISKDPERFGFFPDYERPIEYETVRIDGPVHLKVLARCAGTDLETMKLLNPALRRQQVPVGSLEVRVPPGTGAATVAALDAVPKSERGASGRHVVRKGETLGKIAQRYGVRVSDLQAANGMGKRTLLRVGQELTIPGAGFSAAGASGSEEPSRPRSTATYKVRSGDTLAKIARRYGTTPAAIASASGIRVHSVLRVGQRLKIPGPRGETAEAGSEGVHEPGPVVHTVRRGETLYRIAGRYRVTVDQICALNNISPSTTLYPGTRLTILAK